MNVEKILIDTSVWIDYFQDETPKISDKVDKMVSENEICVPLLRNMIVKY